MTGIVEICVVLSGTKYGLKQTRGKFGLGAKMVNFCSRTLLRSFVHPRLPLTALLYQYIASIPSKK